MKDNLYVGKLFTLPLHQDVKHCPCQSFRAVKVACKQGLPLTWLKYISCITMEGNFLVAAYEHAWTGSGLAVFSLCWSLILSFTISQHLREADFTNIFCPYRRWAAPQGLWHLLCPRVRWLQWQGGSKRHVGTQNAQTSPASPEKKLLTIALLSCTRNEVKIHYSKTAAHVHSGTLENKSRLTESLRENFHLWFLRL